MPETRAEPPRSTTPAVLYRPTGLPDDLAALPALVGEAPVEGQEGWTYVVGGSGSAAGADEIADRYRALGYRVGVLPGRTRDGAAIFRVVVGAFETQREALRVLPRLAGAAFPADTWLLPLR